MTDIAKIIDGLKCHSGDGGCFGCPYEMSYTHSNTTCAALLCKDALELLRTSIPIEPLCEFLAEYAEPPQGYSLKNSKERWKEFVLDLRRKHYEK